NRDEILKKERAKIHKTLANKMGMAVNILDLKFGDQWLDRIFALKFDCHDFVITIAKLRFLANSKMREEKRYLCHLVLEKKPTRLLDQCKRWIDRGNEEVCMYSSSMQGLSNWEIENCPWWLDLGGGYILAREKELYKVYSKKEVVALSGYNAQVKKTTTKKNDVGPLVQELSSKRACLDEEESLALDAYQVQVMDNPYDDL
ncbi:hypothetical protein L7F22_026078, partial [Adiantum nelumboides]|nr:hypothetical protein [Adiantum nelumboides]